jgi:MoaA/NifB/PqqE/SkfB family radical SAM enzyme
MATGSTIMLATWHFHIEVSSKCTLACPRCARQEVPQGLVNTELDLEFFERNFTPEFVLTNVEKITFCGNDGDPIYAHDLIPIIQYLKSIRPVEIVIITNGSHKKLAWWTQLGNLLDSNDSVHFSIDGYDNNSNNLYRVNSDYDSIIVGLQTLRATSRCQIIWAAIAFKFNEHKLEFMQEFAKKLGVDRFQITKSTKFGSVYPTYGIVDPLEPSVKFVSSSHRFDREVTALTQAGEWTVIPLTNNRLFNQIKSRNGVTPLCEIGNKGLYIDARGRLFPCCWVANRYNHNSDWQQLAENFNLHKRTLIDVLLDPFWSTKFQTFHWQECQTKCNSTIVKESYATNW